MARLLQVGDPAPEFIYRLDSGETRRLSALWSSGPAVILWLRHFG